MVVCIVCGGNGFTLHDGLCCECNGTGESVFDCDAIVFEDGSEDIYPDETPEPIYSCIMGII